MDRGASATCAPLSARSTPIGLRILNFQRQLRLTHTRTRTCLQQEAKPVEHLLNDWSNLHVVAFSFAFTHWIASIREDYLYVVTFCYHLLIIVLAFHMPVLAP